MNLNIPASLDDLNLDPFEVRLFLRLTRRNLTNATPESLPNMARACRISERKAQQALKTLLDLNMIHAITRSGFTTAYHVNQEQLWRVQVLESPAAPAPPHQVRTLLEDAGLLGAALEVCATLNQTALESRLTALEHDLTRLGRARVARALHASLENATQSRWGYYRAVLANIDTLTDPRRTPAGDAHPTPAPHADLETPVRSVPVKRQKTMAELLATTPLNGTWGRG